MKTDEALTRFLKKCEELGRSPSTRRHYHGYLRHFADTSPELPIVPEAIEAYLRHRKETPGHRGMHFKCIQAFYTYLEMYEGIKSPVPRSPMGRPPKKGGATRSNYIAGDKVVRGGSQRIEVHLYLHIGADREVRIVQEG